MGENITKYLSKFNCTFVIASGTFAKRLPEGDSETKQSQGVAIAMSCRTRSANAVVCPIGHA
jgi:hypothetical protein